ncbi:MAG: recombinase family protein [Planctomycetes bacterium]|nr:recombinase family protein [Planctomycetota bacterium]
MHNIQAAPFGYRWNDGRLVHDSTEAAILRLLCELFVEHRRTKTVARLLNEKGYRTRTGNLWTDTQVRRLVTATQSQRYAVPPEHGQTERNASDAGVVVPDDLADRCRLLLSERTYGHRPTKKPTHLFSGVTFCGCGEKMYVLSGSSKYVCAACRRKIPERDLETIFCEQLRTIAIDRETIGRHVENVDETIAAREALVASLKSEESKLKAQADRLLTLGSQTEPLTASQAQHYKGLHARLEAIGDQVPAIQGEIDVLKIRVDRKTGEQIPSLHTSWAAMSFGDKRTIVEAVVERITIESGAVTFDLTELSSSETATKGQHHKKARPSIPGWSVAAGSLSTPAGRDANVPTHKKLEGANPVSNVLSAVEIERTTTGEVVVRRPAVNAVITLKGAPARLFLNVAECSPRDVRFEDVLRDWMAKEGRARISIEYLAKLARQIRKALGPELSGFWSYSGGAAAWIPPNAGA